MKKRTQFIREEDLYPDIACWLETRLRESVRNVDIDFVKAFDSHNRYLSDIMFEVFNKQLSEDLVQRYRKLLPEDYMSWTIKVDVFGVALFDSKLCLAIVEVKTHNLSIDDLSQIIGYTKIVKPEISILLSLGTLSESLSNLFIKYNRYDVLGYNDRRGGTRKIHILRWDLSKKDVNYLSYIMGASVASISCM